MNQKLTAPQAQDIINRHAAGEMQKNLASEYLLSPAAVSKIIRGQTWPNLVRPEEAPRQRRCSLNAADIPVIHQRLMDREKPAAIAKDYGVTRQAIADIQKGKTWSHIPKPVKVQTRRRVWEQ